MSCSSHIDPNGSPDFDYSTPEAQAALQGVTALILEIRESQAEQTASILRKLALYERTLGLAVVPVLARRAVIVLARRARRMIQGNR